MPTTAQELAHLGLTDKETDVYLDLIELGKGTPHLISKRTKISRTTVYWALDNLVARGLASLEQKKKTTYYKITRPESLLRMVQEEERHLKEEIGQKKEIAARLIKSIEPLMRETGVSVPKLQFFEGKEGVNSMLYEYLPVWQESISHYDYTWWGYQDHTFPEHYLDWLKHGWEQKLPKEEYKVITNQLGLEPTLKTKAPHRKMKFVPDRYHFSSTIWVVGDYIVLIMSSEKPHYAIQLRNPMFSENLRTIFKMLWDVN